MNENLCITMRIKGLVTSSRANIEFLNPALVITCIKRISRTK